MLQFGMDGVEDMNSVIVDFPPRKSILEYEKMHAELVTSTYIPKYLKLRTTPFGRASSLDWGN